MMKNTKGITLVALVITIIILLILATISIQSLTNTGLFQKMFGIRHIFVYNRYGKTKERHGNKYDK